jgi:galactokinase
MPAGKSWRRKPSKYLRRAGHPARRFSKRTLSFQKKALSKQELQMYNNRKPTGGIAMSVPALHMDATMKATLDVGFAASFGETPQRYFSAPGRTEIGGNHTDHQRGRVLAGAVNLDTVAAVRLNGSSIIRIQSKGYPLCLVDLTDLTPKEEEINTTAALIRGVAARFTQLGCKVEGFDGYCESTVLPGSGLSSSAAYEVLIGTIINHLFFEGKATQPEIAMIGQYAENVFFGKPCGLMDQMASAVGNLVTIDFFQPDQPVIQPVDFDFAACGHALCIIDSGADHADLTDEYAAIPGEIKAVAAQFGKDVLSQIPEGDFYAHIPHLRKTCGDRAVIRCIHYYQENARVPLQVKALQEGNFDQFLSLVKASGYSSYMYLQNVIPAGYKTHQEVAMALALCEHYLQGRGAYRVHGGGFAGTIQAFVPLDMLDDFVKNIDTALGQGACHVLSIRPQGGVEMV